MHRIALLMMIVLLTVTGVSAQDQNAITIALSDDPGTLNPLLTANPNVTALMWSRLLDVDTTTGELVDGIADSWEISSDGLTYTIHIRDDLKWSDGTPITAADYEYAFQAVRSPTLNSPLSRALPPEVFDTFTVVDDYTFTFTIARPNCSVLTRVNSVFALPSHLFAPDLSDVADNTIFTQNGVSSGPYTVVASTQGDSITLAANPNYWKGEPLIPNLVLQSIPDTEQALLALGEETGDLWSSPTYFVPVMNRAGEYVSIGSIASSVTAEERDRLAEENGIPLPENTNLVQVPSTAITYLVMNTADPENPQPRYDASGNRIDQGVHPILGDASVRRALALAAHNYEASGSLSPLIPTNGNFVIPQSWAYDPDLEPRPYSQEEAAALLEEAGWVDDDNNPDTPRVCEGCQYATDGEPLVLKLTYDPTRPETGWVAEAVQQQLKGVGAEVTLVSNALPPPGAPSSILNQDFDMALITLGSFPTDPSFVFDSLLFSTADIPGRGFNMASYANDQVDQLLTEARSVPGCEPEARAEIYRETLAILQEESPYIPLGMLSTNYVVNDRVNGFDPFPGQAYWNIQTWTMNEPPGS